LNTYTGVMYDFTFGNLVTDEKRLEAIRSDLNGVAHHHCSEPPRPDWPITLSATLGPECATDCLTIYYTTDGREPQGAHGTPSVGTALSMVLHGTTWNTILWGYVQEWRVTIPPQSAGTVIRYKVEAWSSLDGTSRFANNQASTSEQATLFAFPIADPSIPKWARESILYHIFLDRFNPGGGRPFAPATNPHDFRGGTLRGVIEKLDYLSTLGVTALWLSPVFPSPSYHGYDASDLFQVEPRLGTLDDLRLLFQEAHDRDIRVLLDFTAHHLSSAHPHFQQARTDPHSPFRDWFRFGPDPDQYETFFGLQHMPRVNVAHPAARAYLIDAACYWLEQGADGFRLDFAQGQPLDFWTDFRVATRRVKPDSVLVGEVIETADRVRAFGDQLDGCLDFLFFQNLRRFLGFKDLSPSQFDAFLRAHTSYFPLTFLRPLFLDSHDTDRFLWVVQGDTRRLKLAATCQFTLAGPPIIYYGSEAGMSQEQGVATERGNERDYEARAPMIWDHRQDQSLLAFYRDLTALRRRHPVLVYGRHVPLVISDNDNLYAYVRVPGIESTLTDDRVVVILNNDSVAHRVRVPVHLAGFLDGQELRDELDTRGHFIVKGGQIEVSLTPYGTAVLV
jgi:cyclomaltodextrinase